MNNGTRRHRKLAVFGLLAMVALLFSGCVNATSFYKHTSIAPGSRVLLAVGVSDSTKVELGTGRQWTFGDTFINYPESLLQEAKRLLEENGYEVVLFPAGPDDLKYEETLRTLAGNALTGDISSPVLLEPLSQKYDVLVVLTDASIENRTYNYTEFAGHGFYTTFTGGSPTLHAYIAVGIRTVDLKTMKFASFINIFNRGVESQYYRPHPVTLKYNRRIGEFLPKGNEQPEFTDQQMEHMRDYLKEFTGLALEECYQETGIIQSAAE